MNYGLQHESSVSWADRHRSDETDIKKRRLICNSSYFGHRIYKCPLYEKAKTGALERGNGNEYRKVTAGSGELKDRESFRLM